MVTKRGKPRAGGDDCPVRLVLSVIGDKWSHVVLFFLGDGPRRFSELKRLAPDISSKMLSQTLARLESEGLATRSVRPGAAPTAEYALTPLGRTFHEPVMWLSIWGIKHAAQIHEVRSRRGRPAPALTRTARRAGTASPSRRTTGAALRS